VKHLPNILTSGRLVLSLALFFAMVTAAGDTPGLSAALNGWQPGLDAFAFVAFVVAAVTDFFDGWLARRLGAVSIWGAILDPISDKVLVCAAILGLMAENQSPQIAIPGGLILFREFTVSALREVTAARGIRLPVTVLAKWKTTIQLIALAGELLVGAWQALGLPGDDGVQARVAFLAHTLLWLAAAATLVTGGEYLLQARKTLR
jgi:CDP-diacylglycerol--glycerol-3-phosphate 3-phosphatidyltransferase